MCSRSNRGEPKGSTPLMKPTKDKKPKEACGVFAVSFNEPAGLSEAVIQGLKALQHRGEDGAGIAFFIQESAHTNDQNSGERARGVQLIKSTGFVGNLVQSINDHGYETIVANAAIGHVRYGTQGGHDLDYVQPISDLNREVAIAFNGQIVPDNALSDTETLLMRFTSFLDKILSMKGECDAFKHRSELRSDLVSELTEAAENEAFSAVAIHGNQIFAFRDRFGTRPLFISRIKHLERAGIAVASETCALNHLDPEQIAEVRPGSFIVIENGVVLEEVVVDTPAKRFCSFEALYFSREDSLHNSDTYYEIRKRLGMSLARSNRELDQGLDVVIGVPQSGMPAALGYSRESGIPLEFGLIKNRYLGRSFIQSSDMKRLEMVGDKLQVQKSAVRGKSVIVVDDTIVRGHTMKRIVGLLKRAGALEVHVRISAPPILSPCTKGVDTGRETKLPAAELHHEQLEAYIGADSLSFLGLNDMGSIIGCELCKDCFKQK